MTGHVRRSGVGNRHFWLMGSFALRLPDGVRGFLCCRGRGMVRLPLPRADPPHGFRAGMPSAASRCGTGGRLSSVRASPRMVRNWGAATWRPTSRAVRRWLGSLTDVASRSRRGFGGACLPGHPRTGGGLERTVVAAQALRCAQALVSQDHRAVSGFRGLAFLRGGREGGRPPSPSGFAWVRLRPLPACRPPTSLTVTSGCPGWGLRGGRAANPSNLTRLGPAEGR